MKPSAYLPWIVLLTLLLAIWATPPTAAWAAGDQEGGTETENGFAIPEEMPQAISRQAGQVKQQIQERALPLFHREPLGFDGQTIAYLYDLLLSTPLMIPAFTQRVIEQGRLLGVVSSLLLLLFFAGLIYGLVGKKRIMARIESRVAPLKNRMPKTIYPYILPIVRVVVAALLPIVLYTAFILINALINMKAAWLTLTGRLLTLWVVGALINGLLRELLTRNLIRAARQHGPSIFRVTRLVVIYTVFGIALFNVTEILAHRADVLAFIRFLISLSIVMAIFLLTLKKNALFSLMPELPHRSYKKFQNFIQRYYFPLILFSLVLALLWSVGYRALGRVVLVKVWSSAAAYLAMMVVYHALINGLQRWHARVDQENEAAQLVYRSFRNLLIYGTSLATILIVLNLLGLLGLIEHAMSFPVFNAGKVGVTLWILIKACVILVAFVFFSRLSQAYLDYRVYPALGIEAGLGYALNTFLKYLVLAIGFVVALNVVGLDLKFLLVFAGAIGIGIGMGLQNMAANVISGFILIFGGKLRKGDWIEVAGTMGMVTDIYLRATKVLTRDEIEYIIPNSEFISGTLVNYSLGSPLIRLDVPVGVSYSANPRQVEQILLDAARNEPSVSNEKPPAVRFVEFGDSSINFQLLVWINVRTTPRRLVRSALYFTIFEKLAEAGIEIPFPQRDIHIRSE